MEEPIGKPTDDVSSYIISLGYRAHQLPNGRCLWRPRYRHCDKWELVVISGEKVILSDKTYDRIEAIAGCSLLFVAENCWNDEENPRDYDHDAYYNKIYSHTKLMLVDVEGNEVCLGTTSNSSLTITSKNIAGGVSFKVDYKVLERKSGYTDKHKWVNYYAYYEVYYQEGKDYVEVIEKRGESSRFAVAETNAYRLYFSTGIREIIDPTVITKTLKSSGQ